MQDLSLNSNTFHGPWQSVAIMNQPVGILKRDKFVCLFVCLFFAAAACFGFFFQVPVENEGILVA